MNNKEFARRRKNLMHMVGSGGIAILPAAPIRTRSRDVEYRFRQDSDFYYLTGFAEPDAEAVLAPGRDNGEYLLFCRERDRERERWDGKRKGPDGAVEHHGADDAFPIDDIDDILPGIMESCERVYYTMGLYPDFDTRIADWVNSLRSRGNRGVHTPQEFVALDHLLHDMCLYKSRSEISAMRRSAKVAVAAHTRAMQMVRPGMNEYEVEAEFIHEFRRYDARHSYSPIVASGGNACTLHYVDNSAPLNDGDLLLIDAGCELDYYASDITRTFPVNGKFSPEQRAVYEIVLEAQLAAIEKTRKDNHWDEPHDAAVKVITKGLRKIGLLEGSLPKLIKDGAYREFYMHRTSHWLGLDVHDVGAYTKDGEPRALEPGMVFTVEPGLYVSRGDDGAASFQGIGVRIEDDVVVTEEGCEILTEAIPKDPDEVEAWVRGT